MLLSYLNSVVRDGASVDDLFQETMVVAWRRLDDCDLSRPFGPWLRGIASRLVMAHYRKRNSLPLFLDDQVLLEVDRQFESINRHEGDTWDEKVAALNDCIEALPENSRKAVRSRYLEEAKINDVAVRLGVTVEACKKRLQRARVMLVDCMVRKGVMMPAEAVQ